MNTVHTDIVIVGAGPVGMSLFLELARMNRKVVLLDKSSLSYSTETDASAQEWDARNYALSPANVTWLEERLGVSLSETLHQQGTPMKAMHVVYEAGKAFFELSAHQMRQSYLAWMVRHDHLCSILASKVFDQPLASSIDDLQSRPQGVFSSVELEKLEWFPDHVRLIAQYQSKAVQFEAKLVIGADGAQSWVREQARVEVKVKPYPHHALVGCFETERPHGGIAYQWFKKNGDIMAWLPMPQGVGVVWSHTEQESASYASFLHNPQKLADELSLGGQNRLGRWRYQGGMASFPLSAQSVNEPLPSSRLLLIGDAKHRIHPLAGQGLNIGLLEVRQLTDVLRRFPLHDPGHPWLGSALHGKETVAQKMLPLGMDVLWRANQPNTFPPMLQKVVGLGWGFFHESAILKRMILNAVSL